MSSLMMVNAIKWKKKELSKCKIEKCIAIIRIYNMKTLPPTSPIYRKFPENPQTTHRSD